MIGEGDRELVVMFARGLWSSLRSRRVVHSFRGL